MVLIVRNKDWKYIWSLPCPQKIRNFILMVLIDKLQDKEKLYRKNIVDTPTCDMCNHNIEYAFHILFNCPVFQPVWNFVHTNWNVQFNLEPFNPSWFKKVAQVDKVYCDLVWISFFPHLLWKIWIARNNFYFQNKVINCRWIIKKAMEESFLYQSALTGRNSLNKRREMEIHVHWELPRQGFAKLNIDGAYDGLFNAGIGGVIWDEQGRFRGGFAKYTYNCGSNVGELCAIREGLFCG